MHRGGEVQAQIPSASSCRSVESIQNCRYEGGCVDGSADTPEVVGPIRVDNATVPINLVPTAAGYPVFDSNQPLFVGGERLSVSVDDGAAVLVQAPAQPTITTIPATDPVAIDRSQDYDVGWSGGAAGDLTFVFSDGVDQTDRLTCTVPAISGHGTIPAAAMARMQHTASLYVLAVSQATIELPNGSLIATASFEAVLLDGTAASLHVAFQP